MVLYNFYDYSDLLLQFKMLEQLLQNLQMLQEWPWQIAIMLTQLPLTVTWHQVKTGIYNLTAVV